MAKAKKGPAKKSRVRAVPARRRTPAGPLPDNPFLRHKSLRFDRVFGSEGKPLGQLRLAALQRTLQMPTAAEGGPVPPTLGISNWVQMGPTAIPNGQTYGGTRVLVTGRVTAIVVDPTNPSTIYVGTAKGGVWRTSDGGTTWVAKSDNEVSLAIGALAIDPTNPQVLYAGTGEGNLYYLQDFLQFAQDSYYGDGILKSTDGGNTWMLQGGMTFTGAAFFRIAINPMTPATVFAAASNGLYRSTNGGTNWTRMTNGLPSVSATALSGATDVTIDPSTPTTVYAAFWDQGIYKTTNANAANPTWTKLTGGLPTTNLSRIGLGISPSSPQTVYAALARRFFVTTNSGNVWNSIPLPAGAVLDVYGNNLAVDPTTPDIVYLSGYPHLWKAVRNPLTGVWTITNIGLSIHPDNHAFAFHPTNHLVVYAGSDGGIYRSSDGGMTWSDSINRGLCIAQFEFMDQHPTSDAVAFAGTQDNGTEQFRNSPVFYHAADGDGGFVSIDPSQPRNVIHEYYDISPERSTQAGKFGTWADVSGSLSGNSLFYPPFTLDQSNPNNIAFGGDQVFLDTAQGTGGWPTSITLPGMRGLVSAINYVNANLIYAATNLGEAYRLTRSGGGWAVTAIHTAPLPARFIWDIVPRPDDSNTVILVMAGFGTAHVWRGAVPASGAATWTDISGTGAGRLPDIPINALTIEPATPDIMYVGTDIGVFRTTDGGTTWTQFSQGLPNSAVFDLRLHSSACLLRVATHGRGMWERRLDIASMLDVNLFVRDNLMDTGRSIPPPSGVAAAFEDPLQHVALGDTLWWYQCADIKVDTLEGSPLSYQMNVADVDYVAFESELEHRNPQRGRINRVYVQVHNRGIQPAHNVTVKVLHADASAGLPDLPADFWTAFPGDSADTSHWKPIGAALAIPTVLPTEPTIVEWDWNTPLSAADHSCLLVVTDCPEDAIPAANKVFTVGALVNNEKRVGLKNLHVVNALAGRPYWTPLRFFGDPTVRPTIRVSPSAARRWKIGLLLQKGSQKNLKLDGFSTVKPTKTMLSALKARIGPETDKYDTTLLYTVQDVTKGGALVGATLPKGVLQAMVLFVPPTTATVVGTVSIVQEADQNIVGGSTFVLRRVQKQ